MPRSIRRGIMKTTMKYGRFLDYAVYLLVRLLEEVFNLLPDKPAFAFGRFVGRLIYIIIPDRREAALENLTIAFGGEKTPAWIKRTALKSFEHLGQLAVEFMCIRRWPDEKMAERIVLKGRLPYNLAVMPGKHGIVLLNSHFGCFEVSAATVKFLGLKLNLIATGLKNPFLSRYFATRAGKDTGITFFPHKGSVKELIARLSQGEMMACLADQRGDPERGIFVDFFGTQAPANEVFARMAIDGKALVLPLCTYRLEDGRYASVFGDVIHLELTGDRRADLTAVSQQFHDLFEQWLRMCPEQGFWLHRKWKRKPSRRRGSKK